MPKEYINWPQPEEYISFEDGSKKVHAPAPRVGVHWDGVHGTVQLSLDVDWDILQEMVQMRKDNPDGWFGEDEGNFPNRVVFYTAGLDRAELQRLIKHARRARNDAFGSDE